MALLLDIQQMLRVNVLLGPGEQSKFMYLILTAQALCTGFISPALRPCVCIEVCVTCVCVHLRASTAYMCACVSECVHVSGQLQPSLILCYTTHRYG